VETLCIPVRITLSSLVVFSDLQPLIAVAVGKMFCNQNHQQRTLRKIVFILL
jgi:hypothetical protein